MKAHKHCTRAIFNLWSLLQKLYIIEVIDYLRSVNLNRLWKKYHCPQVHNEEVVGFGISSNGKFMMSCSSKTDMIIYDLKGQILERLDTYLMNTHSAKISPCGRFVVATGFSPDVKVMEVCFTKNGDFKQVK